jgi:hypothetical protein
MKIRSFEIEATREELDSSSILAELLARLTSPAGTGDTKPGTVSAKDIEADDAAAQQAAAEAAETPAPSMPDAVPGVPTEGQEVVRGLLDRNPTGDLFVRFLAEATTWPSVLVHGIKPKGHTAGTPLDYSRYLRLRKQGSQFGGFAYAYPANGYIHLRLNFASEDEKNAAAPNATLTPQGHREYGVEIYIRDESTLRQAIELAQRAYDRT